MTGPTGSTRYEIEIGGHASDRVLRPVVDEFTVELTAAGTTRLVGDVLDSSHLNGLLAHFSSLNVEVLALRRLGEATGRATAAETSTPNIESEREQP